MCLLGSVVPCRGWRVCLYGRHPVEFIDDHNLILGKVLDSLGDAIRGLKLLPETSSVDELERIKEASHHVGLTLQALDVD